MDSSPAAETFAYIIWHVWLCLSLSSEKIKHPIYAIVLSTLDAVDKLAASAFLEFAPRLLDVLQSDSPPSINFFKGLSSNGKGLWAVYALVLEKKASRPRLYIGSGTCYTGGVHRRFNNYVNKEELPKYVKRSLDEGYKISHKGLLCWSPIPESSRLRTRVLFLALEATFSSILWAMNNRDKSYGMPLLCKWSRESFEWDGLCSHFALLEGVQGKDGGLTLEELEAADIALKLRREEARKLRVQKRRDFKKNDFAAWQAQRLRYWNNRDLALYAASRKRTKTKALALRKFYCDICNSNFSDSRDLNIHKNSQKHILKVSGKGRISKAKDQKTAARREADRKSGKYSCAICVRSFLDQSKLDRHEKTEKHARNARAANLESSSQLD
jgi:hypothetical protein